jgi:hypothetical protein
VTIPNANRDLVPNPEEYIGTYSRKILVQKGLKFLKVLPTGDKTERADHANGYNPSTVRSTGIPCIAERSDKPFMHPPSAVPATEDGQ